MNLPKIVAAGIYDSNIAIRNISVSRKRKATMFEIELPLEHGGISYIEDTSIPITPNMIICVKPGQIRRTRFPFKCYFVHMILHEGLLHDALVATPDYFEIQNRDVYESIYKRLIKHYNALSEGREIILQSVLLELIHTITQDSSRRVNTNNTLNTSSLTENAINYIKNHLTEDLALENMAKAMSLSPIYFHTIFRASVGKTLRDYVEEQRLKKAINLLLTTSLSLTDIAYECGFSSQSYFSYVFKRKMNTTPRNYVKDYFNNYET